MAFETITNDAGATTGYTYAITEGDVTNTITYDANFEQIGEAVVDSAAGTEFSNTVVVADDGSYVESGSEKFTVAGSDETFERTFEFKYDSSGALTEGTEVVNGETIEYGADFAVTSVTADTSGLTALSEEARSALPAAMISSVAADASIFTSTESFGDDFSETTYYDASGSILGYSNDFSHSWGNETMTGTDFMNADWEYLGHSGSDGEATWSHFETRGTDADGNVTITETGTETYGDETREFTFVFDENFNLISGEETIDGVTTKYGANWSVTGETADVSALGDALSETALSGVPTALVSSLDDGLTYSKTEQFDWGGSETTYFNSEGTTLGFSFSFEDNFGSSVSYEDANHNWLGGSWSDNEGRSGYNSTSQSTDESGNLIYIETGGFSDTNTGESSTFTWRFDSNWNMIGGTETRGSTTYTYGANWEITDSSTEIDLESGEFAVLDLASLPDLVVANLFAGQETVYIAEEEFPWGGKQTTYFTADGDVIGYGDSWDDDWGSGTTYMNADWEFIGSEWDDDWGSGYQFTVQGSESDDFAYNEFGEQTWINYNGEEETRSFDFKFDENWNLISGTETMDDGSTITFGANWEIVSETRTVNLEADNIVALTDEQKNDLPDALVATTGETYSETNTMPWGDTETTYLTADGIILGYSHAWSDEEYGSSGVSYNDAEWNHLGSSWEDEYGSGYHHTVEAIDTDGSVTGTEGATYYIESGSHTHKDPEGNEHTSTHEFKFDENWNMLGGTEKRGDTDVVFGANWEIISETTDTSNLDSLTTEQLDALPDAVVTALFGTETAIKYSTEKFDWGGGTQTTFYDANGNVLGYQDNWSDDWDGDGTPNSTGESFMDENWNHIGSSWDDEWGSGFNFTVEELDSDGNVVSRTESGEHTWENYEGVKETRSFEFKYDADWNLIEGTETHGDGTEITFGANWEIVSEKRTVDLASDKVKALSDAEKDDLPDALVAATGETYAETNQTPWGDVETTYLTADGEILGYSHQWGDVNSGEYGIGYNDAEWNHLGSFYNDQYGSGFNFTVEAIDTDGSVTGTTGATYYIETGSNTHNIMNEQGVVTDTETSTREFIFDENWNMLGGTEKRGDTEIVFGANWTIVSEKTDTSNLQDFDLSTLPDTVKTALFGTETTIKYSTDNFDWGGSQTTFYDSDGNVLGYQDQWSDDWNGDGTPDSTGESFMDENWHHIGGSWSDEYGSGYNFTTEEFDSDGNLVSRTETGEHTHTFTDPLNNTITEKRTFTYKYDADWNLIEGEETSSDGRTTTYGANWEMLGQKADVSALTALNDTQLGDIPDPLKAASGDTFSTQENFDWGGSQTTYYDSAGKILGYMDTWSDGQGGGGSSFMDAEWNFLGSSWSDEYGSGENIRIDNYDSSGNYTGYTEKGSNTHNLTNESGVVTGTETRSFEFNFNAAGEMTGGTETHPDGRTVTLGPNWEVQGETMDVSGLSEVTGSDLEALPTALKAATGSKTYSSTRDMEWGNGKQTTYLDESGKVLGYKDTWSDDWDGDGTVDSEGFSYMDSNWNHLGGGGTDDWGTWSSSTVTNSDGTITETHTNTDADGNFSRTEVRNYDANYNFLGSEETITEKEGSETIKFKTVFDANYNITAQYMDDGSGDGFSINDPFALFQPGDFVISNTDLEYYATNVENLPLYDFDGNGVSDAIESDMDADGKVDLVYDFAKHLLQSTMFVDDPDAAPGYDSDGNFVSIELTGTAENVSDHISGHYGKFNLTMTGTFSVNSDVVGDPQDPEDIDGTVTGISISHIPTGATEGVVIATNDGLSFTWSELIDNMDNGMPDGGGPDDGPKAVDGYYPLYHDKQDAEDASSVGAAHKHSLIDGNNNPLDMWMPDGGSEGTDYFHGTYPTDTEDEDPYLDIATSNSTDTTTSTGGTTTTTDTTTTTNGGTTTTNGGTTTTTTTTVFDASTAIYLPYGDEAETGMKDAGELDANDSFIDNSSDGIGKVAVYGDFAKGELTQAQKGSQLADIDIYQLVDMAYGSDTTLSQGTYELTVSEFDWDISNAEYIGGVSSFRIMKEGMYTIAEQSNHVNISADTLTFDADGTSNYFVEIIGDGLGDAQYEIDFDLEIV